MFCTPGINTSGSILPHGVVRFYIPFFRFFKTRYKNQTQAFLDLRLTWKISFFQHKSKKHNRYKKFVNLGYATYHFFIINLIVPLNKRWKKINVKSKLNMYIFCYFLITNKHKIANNFSKKDYRSLNKIIVKHYNYYYNTC